MENVIFRLENIHKTFDDKEYMIVMVIWPKESLQQL